MVTGRPCQRISVQRQRIQTLQHVVQNIGLLNGRQLGQQLMNVLQRLRQSVQCELEFADRCMPEIITILHFVHAIVVVIVVAVLIDILDQTVN